jgi:hypothetical protein
VSRKEAQKAQELDILAPFVATLIPLGATSK